jgi:DNA transposition AAA+ family ATPase
MDQHHFLNLPGARVVATEQLLDTGDLVTDLIEVGAMGAVYGPAGTGKTFAVAQALADRPASSWVRTTFRSRPTTRFVRHELYTALGLGVVHPTSPVETDRLMKRALGERFRLVVIDEAQWLNRECFEYFRHLHDDPQTTFALLFVGGAGCYEVLHRETMLDSRLYAHVQFAPLTPKQVLQVIPVYHRIYGGVDPSLITLVNEQCARGNFRTWAKFTQHAVRIMERDGRPSLDEEIARNVFVRLGTGHYARPSAA